MSGAISPAVLNHYNSAGQDFLINQEAGRLLYYNIIREKGAHVLILGSPGSGKTQKMYYLVSWLQALETIVWIDSCKNNEAAPLLKFKKFVRFIIPAWCSLKIENCPAEYDVVEAAFPGDVWQLVKPGAINIVVIRAFFKSDKARSLWIAKLFKSMNEQAYNMSRNKKPNLKRILPMTVCSDEFQTFCPSTSLTSDKGRLEAGQEVVSNILEVRAFDIRLIGATQDWSFILPGARRNLPARILCRGSIVKQSESPKLYRLRKYFENYEPSEGLFVFQDGSYFPSTCPWSFPLFKVPEGCSIEYSGYHDEPDPDLEKAPDVMDWDQYAGRFYSEGDQV